MKYFTTPENQAKWSMGTGYVAVRESTQEVEEFKSYAERKILRHWFRFSRHLTEHRLFRIRQEERFWMPCQLQRNKVELENVPAQEALDEAQKNSTGSIGCIIK